MPPQTTDMVEKPRSDQGIAPYDGQRAFRRNRRTFSRIFRHNPNKQ